MRTRFTAILFLALCFFAPGAVAQFFQPVFFMSGGLAVPASPDGWADARGAGPSAGAGVGLALSSHVLGRLSGDYAYMPAEDAEGGADAGQVLTATANMVLAPTGLRYALRPYALAGGGYYRVSGRKNADGVGPRTESTYGLMFGAGLDFIVGEGVGIFAESAYLLGFTNPEQSGHTSFRLGIAFQ